MMYSDIAEALQTKGVEANPKDYWLFSCIGHRERKKTEEYEPSERPEHNSDYSRA
jgi:phospholipase D1/2